MKPNRKPDFTWKVHEFWLEPEMITYNGSSGIMETLVEQQDSLFYVWHVRHSPDLLRSEIQDLYREFKVEQILLTDSKSD